MEITGQTFINPPHAKVRRALLDAGTLDACFAEAGAVKRVSDTEFQVRAPVHGLVRISQDMPDTLVFQADRGRVQVTLARQAEAMTVLRYVLETDAQDAERARSQVDQLIEAFKAEVSGPREFAASGAAGAQAAAIND